MLRPLLASLILLSAPACAREQAPEAPPAPVERFPAPHRPVADIVSSAWSRQPDRDAADENGQIVRALGIDQGWTVADIGAGAGYHTLRLSPVVGPSGRVIAQDVVEAYIHELRGVVHKQHLTNVDFVVGAYDDPRLKPASLDAALMVHMYHEIESPYAFLWRLAPALKPGGRVAVVDLDRPFAAHGTPKASLKCEFEAVGYTHVSTRDLEGGIGYLAIFTAPAAEARPRPDAIRPCSAE
jgi:predicted methyltransferase